MKRLKPQYKCSLELAMELVGGKWKLVLLWHLLSGTHRFCELKRKLGDITQKMLTLQLRELEEAGLITRTVYPVVPPRVDYELTERGRAQGPLRVGGRLCRREGDCLAAQRRGDGGRLRRKGGLLPWSLTFGGKIGNALGLANVPALRRSSCSKVCPTGCPARSAP